ncbi:hypothetical protein [Ottowia thiooxydans]|uniref:Uncharacterized protein n=1 Tax=Ottowia thiooxydans TaxID=219182 RepID=A0ABV2QC22_9BURK
MVTAYVESERVVGPGPASIISPSSDTAVSWAAIFAGALAAAILSLLLFMLGIGLGLSSMSVWSGRGADGETIGWAAIAWLAFTQIASAGVGGYIAGRLRTKWQGVHTDEVYFRDTAHGFLAWALATMLMVAVMGSVAGAALTNTVKAAGAVATGAATAAGGATGAVANLARSAVSQSSAVGANRANAGADSESGLHYWASTLLRSGPSTAPRQDMGASNAAATGATPAAAGNGTSSASGMSPGAAAPSGQTAAVSSREVATIFGHSLKTGALSNEDAQYLAQVVSQNTGMAPDAAQARVQKAFSDVKAQMESAKKAAEEAEVKAKQVAEEARKATAYSMLWMFVALLIGAFAASVAATVGGRQRDT